MIKPAITLFAPLLLATLLSCLVAPVSPSYATDQVPPQTSAPAQHRITVTDISGRQVSLNVPVHRMLLGEGRQLYLVASLESKDPLSFLAGWKNDLIEADPATYAQYLAKFPKLADLPTFGGKESGLIDLESAIVQKPDVVLLNLETQRATAETAYIEKLASLGIPVLYIDFRHQPLKNTEPTIRLLGEIMGRESRADEIIAFRKKALAQVTDVIAQKKPARPNVFVERIGGYTDDCCLTFGNENFGRYVEIAGGHNIGGDFLPGTFGQLNPEQVIATDPDQVIVTSANWQAYVPGGHWIPLGPGADMKEAEKKLEWFTTRKAYSGTKALKTRSFHGIWHQFYNSPYEFIAIQQIAKWLHPDLFANLDPDETFREYHRLFLPIDYKPGYSVSLTH
ncbi:ABC transporter substrate-binding protein [Rhizobium oryziradicis]|uniref:ABC transporter substrate-binding protein n=1 Tax=Rhizobium oryziradicis TaxID=1867956 RepID=A0A1Q8ZL63_9HYPH|nr:ABC transporter substrate-binding protein [Rhizobium oryziradicis]OLP42522.1 ABC transporter substrate-binding protein [Rhizobium oryziradicis]